ncbi:hypothetical protein ABFA07_020384 [Porites harrisoni]
MYTLRESPRFFHI